MWSEEMIEGERCKQYLCVTQTIPVQELIDDLK